MVSRLRAVFLLLVLVPQAVIFQMTKSSPLAADKYFGQAAGEAGKLPAAFSVTK
ncbi:MAG: hypothetical protein K0Q75_2639 [Anaerospora sp.]|nr:hypothetical protein [Anaerospora sp.]